MRVHFIIHDYFEAPGAYEYWARKNNYDVTFTRLYEGDKLPDSISGIDFLIIMGGPQSRKPPLRNALILIPKKSRRLSPMLSIQIKLSSGSASGHSLSAKH